MLLPDSLIKDNSTNNITYDSTSPVQMSSNSPPNKDFFKYYKEIIIDHTKVSGTESHKNFSVLISILDSDLRHDVQSNGNDIAFANEISWLDHEIEIFNQTYDETHAQLITWVRVPILHHNKDTKLYMYYGNSTMGPQEDPSGVWSSNYKGVWHLGDGVMNSSSYYYDSTINNNDGKALNSPINDTTSKIDGGVTFDDSNERAVNISHSSSLQCVSNFSISAWFRSTDFDSDVGVIMNKWSTEASKRNYWLGKLNENEFAFFVDDNSDVRYGWSNLNDGNWHHVVATAASTTLALNIYIDGSLVASDSWDGISITGDSELHIGKATDTIDQEFNGDIDELHVLDTVLDLDWISTEYTNQHNPNSFYSVSTAKKILSISDFDYYKEIVIDHTKVTGSSDLINFPVLISILDSDLHDHTQPDGDDIAFYDGSNWLDHEIEYFNQTYSDTHAKLVAWVRIPALSPSTDTNITMYFGNTNINSHQNPNGIWRTHYKAIWHLKEDPGPGDTGDIKDSTLYNNDGTAAGTMTSDDQMLGKIDGSINFDGVNEYIGVDNIGAFTNLTISAWIKPKSWAQAGEDYIHQIIGDEEIFAHGTLSFRLGSSGLESYKQRLGLAINISSTWSDFESQSDLSLNTWQYVAVTFNGNDIKFYINGDNDKTHSNPGIIINTENNWDIGGVSNYNFRYFDGNIDELRIADTAFTTDWIATEYNNQYDPISFYTIGSLQKFDSVPPTYELPIESSNPLELGEIEVITINISDPSGINQSLIEFEGVNHSMVNIIGDSWQYNWTAPNVGNYSYTIWMEDNFNNWNSTTGSIEVLDTTPPTYSDLIESANNLQLGQNETIEIKVFDSFGSGVNKTLLEYDSTNHSMVFMGQNKWSWSNWKPTTEGVHSYKIYMQDNQDNWNMTSGNITVITTTAPFIENHTEIPDPLELGDNITITVDVFDNETWVSTVLIELKGENHTMSYVAGNSYEYIWTGSSVETINYKIYANDTGNNWNSLASSFDIVDTTLPIFSGLIESENPLELGNTQIITINCTDLADINQVKIEFEGLNHSMLNIGGDTWQYDQWTPLNTGNYTYSIWGEDKNHNWNKFQGYIIVQDTILPIYSNLTESADPIEIGTSLTISINITDIAGIKQVLIEYENSNHTMENIMGDIWQYDSWMSTSIGNYSYKIYMKDNNDNINSVSDLMTFQDTVLPTYSDLFESADPLELGNNIIIRIDTYDIAGINQTLIEFEGVNHTMTNIYGDRWEFNSWTPTNWTVYQYRIYMEDMSGNWNLLTANITVQDTTPPPSPVLTVVPSGDVSGILTFDWLDGSDPSGILYYILIIDNETDHVYIFNITNEGPESSCYELPDVLPLGRYNYFLAQVDGVGQQSSYTTGSFTVISVENGTPGNNNLIIIAIITASVISSVAAIVIVRKKLKKNMTQLREKISFKMISSHINKLLSSQSVLQKEKIQDIKSDDKQEKVLISKEFTKEEDIEKSIKEIKDLGEQLFAEGAYLEALEQFKIERDLLLNFGRKEEAKLFSELITGVEGLINEREKRLESLPQIKKEDDSVAIYETFNEIIEISEKLRDPDTASLFQSELVNYFQNNKLNVGDLGIYRFDLNQEAKSLENQNLFEKAALLYKKCEKISKLLVEVGNEEELVHIERFRNKKNECLKKKTLKSQFK